MRCAAAQLQEERGEAHKPALLKRSWNRESVPRDCSMLRINSYARFNVGKHSQQAYMCNVWARQAL